MVKASSLDGAIRFVLLDCGGEVSSRTGDLAAKARKDHRSALVSRIHAEPRQRPENHKNDQVFKATRR